MMTPMAMAGLATGARLGGAGFGMAGALSQGKADKAQAERNAYIARTRAIQTDTAAREGLVDEMGAMRAVLATNGQQPQGAVELIRHLRQTREKERRVEFGNRMQEAADWRMQGKNAMSAGRSRALGSILTGAQSMFDLYQIRNRAREEEYLRQMGRR